MISYRDYLRALPKTELHCHLVSTMSADTMLRLAATHGVRLPADDPAALFDYDNLIDFLAVFNAAHDVLRDPQDFAGVAYEGVRIGVAAGNLRYREYFVNPQNFAARGIGYRALMEPLVDGLRAAEADFGVGFRLVAAINRHHGPAAAVALVEEVVANPIGEVVGIGQDDLTPEGTESPERFRAAYDLAHRHGLRCSAHAGETMAAPPENVLVAVDELGCDRVDHGYRIVDRPDLLDRVRDRGVPFTCTPVSTLVLSGWALDPTHRIRAMIDAGLTVTISTDDAVFFGTDIGREYADALHGMGVTPDGAKRIALAGIDAAWCSDEEKRRLRAEFRAQFLALDALLDPAAVAAAA